MRLRPVRPDRPGDLLERVALRAAVPRKIGRHSHPKAKPEVPGAPPPATGIDYLAIIAAEHAEAARRHRIRYDALAGDGDGASGDGGAQEAGQ